MMVFTVTRRDVIIGGALAMASASSLLRLEMGKTRLFYDADIVTQELAAQFANRFSLSLWPSGGDVGRLGMTLQEEWKSNPRKLFGLTTPATLFVLQHFARRSAMTVAARECHQGELTGPGIKDLKPPVPHLVFWAFS